MPFKSLSLSRKASLEGNWDESPFEAWMFASAAAIVSQTPRHWFHIVATMVLTTLSFRSQLSLRLILPIKHFLQPCSLSPPLSLQLPDFFRIQLLHLLLRTDHSSSILLQLLLKPHPKSVVFQLSPNGRQSTITSSPQTKSAIWVPAVEGKVFLSPCAYGRGGMGDVSGRDRLGGLGRPHEDLRVWEL